MNETLTVDKTTHAADAAHMRALTPTELNAASGAAPNFSWLAAHYFEDLGGGVILYCSPSNQCKLIFK